MIQLGAAVLCDAATIRENVLHVLGAGVSQMFRGNFPAPLGAEIALLLYIDGEPNVEVQHRVTGECRLRNSDAESVFGFEYTLRTVIEPNLGAQSVSAIIPATGFGVPEAGAYEITIAVDDERVGAIPFTAILDEGLPQQQFHIVGKRSASM
ncbi:hypothetical protein HUN59_14650 [Curtobacterium sp. Csp2]|uniref:DUF6941 family protein n=1 Tax=Curtobacterium sp. Csp2 TaxID=2495430 RepID=UPI001580E8E6|nr:hypothetical protein [Curtobacterium sp. Csp2]QKS17280.1 hypothetical protein HUN59_14650 [Curtobacterium sp. Csp2]